MRKITYRDSLREALREEMQRDSRVFLLGEDIGRFWGGAFYEQLEAPDEITIVGPIFLSLVTIISTYVLARREIKKDMLALLIALDMKC